MPVPEKAFVFCDLALSYLLCFSPQTLFVPLFTVSFQGLPSCFHCLFLAVSSPSGPMSVGLLHLNPALSLCACTSLPFSCMCPGTSSSSLSPHLCLSHCWLALSPFLAYLFYNPPWFQYLLFLTFIFSTHPLKF